MNWIVKDGLIEAIQDNMITFPMAEEIFSSAKEGIGLKYFKLFALNFEVTINCEGGSVRVRILALKGDKRFEVKTVYCHFADYVIIENVCYYINPLINSINEAADSLSFDLSQPINFFEYIRFIQELEKEGINYHDEVIQETTALKADESTNVHPGFVGSLFPYQESGVKWLNFMIDGQCGCILADSMGLGKTLQIILALGHLKECNQNAHFLIIAPLSILENWEREIKKFYPSLKSHINHGDSNITFYKELLEYDVIVTSYGSVQTNFSTYEMIKWDCIVLDEAQNIKNPYAKRTQTIKNLDREIGIAVTGTPFENHVSDIWSITDFVLPGYLDTLFNFNKTFGDDIYSASELERKISPIMLRRKVEDVATDLPYRIDIPQPLRMTIEEAKYYDAGLKSFDELKVAGLDQIQRLRMFCTHPAVFEPEYEMVDPTKVSQKYTRCCEIIEEIMANGEKALIFTSFNKMISILVSDLNRRFGVFTDYINGSIDAKERQKKIDNFSSIDGPAALVLNPKAAGAGLNITAANHVIHYNLEWNPAVEDQASARSYRRGQAKTVFVHRLFYLDTIEEVINERVERKRLISEAVVVGNEGVINDKDLARALSLSPLK